MPADVSRALVTATSSSRFVVPNYWADPKSGIAYQVQVEDAAARRAHARRRADDRLGGRPGPASAEGDTTAGRCSCGDVADDSSGHDARAVRSLQHEAAGDADGERRRRGPRDVSPTK